MAGGKETPRQKMIGMMYLVLTALLALQVSNAVLEKFVDIDRALVQSVQQGQVRSNETLSRISKAVDDAGNRASDQKQLEAAKEVQAKTREVISYLEDLKEEMVTQTGGYEETESGAKIPKNLKEDEKISFMMVQENKGAKGEELKKTLNDYVQFLNQKTGSNFKPIAFDGENDPYFKNFSEHNNKDFATLKFDRTPLGAALATVSQFETEVVARETAALDEIARSLGAEDVKFDKIVPMVRAESNIVAAGAKYKADMFISASSSGITPTMKMNGSDIAVDGGFGKVEFVAQPGQYDKDGLAKKSFEAAISVRLPSGKDTTYTETIEYFVAKPVIQVQSQSVQALYLNCGNELNVQVPALGSSYNPTFSASGANTIPGSQRGLVTVVPQAAEVALTVRNDGNVIGTEKFKVRRVPKPEVRLTSRGKELNQKAGESISRLRSLEINAVAEEGFAQFLPKDARYRVNEWTITLARGNRPVGSPIRATSEKVNLSSLLGSAKAGDRLVVEVKGVQRMNFRGKIENVNMSVPPQIIPLN
ncbi:gliding motility protein GldM [Roseivirga sp. BDSF3-8]|uniref:type IX secretion system motor protein PorM/GldM n=1 Tax=Roseivirga sp. BDSF3-8 TaxID=3241598 RepID=UPI003531F9E0